MPNWTTFDDETSATLRSRVAAPNIEQRPPHLALEHILQRGETLVAVMPGGMLDQAALAVFRWNHVPVVQQPAPPPRVKTHAGGFLGLTDEPDFEEEEIQEKKSWWRRFWDGD